MPFFLSTEGRELSDKTGILGTYIHERRAEVIIQRKTKRKCWETFYLFIKKFFCNMYLLLRNREKAQAGEEQRERETQNPKQALDSELSAHSPTWGSSSQTMRS